MATSTPPSSRSPIWLVILGLVSLFIVGVMVTIVCYLLVVGRTVTQPNPNPTATKIDSLTELNLPTAIPPTATVGPPAPLKLIYAAQDPIVGFSSCTSYGFKGNVAVDDKQEVKDIEVIIWEDQAELFGLDTLDEAGNYAFEVSDSPTQRRFWVQVFENDVPVSEAVSVEIQPDCQEGFQIYQVDWRKANLE